MENQQFPLGDFLEENRFLNSFLKAFLYLTVIAQLLFPSLGQAKPFAYVANFSGQSVSVIDINTNSIVATINVGINPASMAITPDGRFVYVENKTSAQISVIETNSNTVVGTINVPNFFGGGNQSIQMSPDGTKLYSLVADGIDKSIYVIDTQTNTIGSILPLSDFSGPNPNAMAVYPSGSFMLIFNTFSGSFFQILDLKNEVTVATISGPPILPSFTPGLAISKDENFGYYVPFNSDLEIIKLNSRSTSTFPAQSTGSAIGATPDGRFIVFHQESPSGQFYNLLDSNNNTSAATINNTLDSAFSISFTSDSKTAYISYFFQDVVEVVDLHSRSITTQIMGFNAPFGVVVQPEIKLNLRGTPKRSRFLTQTSLINTLAWDFLKNQGINIKE